MGRLPLLHPGPRKKTSSSVPEKGISKSKIFPSEPSFFPHPWKETDTYSIRSGFPRKKWKPINSGSCPPKFRSAHSNAWYHHHANKEQAGWFRGSFYIVTPDLARDIISTNRRIAPSDAPLMITGGWNRKGSGCLPLLCETTAVIIPLFNQLRPVKR